MSLQEGLENLFVVSLVAALAPLVAAGRTGHIERVSNVGLGFLFMLGDLPGAGTPVRGRGRGAAAGVALATALALAAGVFLGQYLGRPLKRR
jgi:hypothetical protein